MSDPVSERLGRVEREALRARWEAAAASTFDGEGRALLAAVARWDWYAKPARSFVPAWDILDPSSHGVRLAAEPARPRFEMEAYGVDSTGELVAVRRIMSLDDAAPDHFTLRAEHAVTGSRWLEFRELGGFRAEHRVHRDAHGRPQVYEALAKRRYERWSYHHDDGRLVAIVVHSGEWRSRKASRSERRFRFVHDGAGVARVVTASGGDERTLWVRPAEDAIPDGEALAASLRASLEVALASLRARTQGEALYYVTLTTDDEAIGLALSAWTEEALAAATKGDNAPRLRWSSADSPYADVGSSALDGARERFRRHAARGPLRVHRDARLDAMVEAMRALDATGAFGTGASREEVLVAVEVMPPAPGNTARVRRLNPEGSAALGAWLREAAEPK
ncbi:MAG: DUF4303 domain-containing protein [Myxococcota bacterium]